MLKEERSSWYHKKLAANVALGVAAIVNARHAVNAGQALVATSHFTKQELFAGGFAIRFTP